MAPSYNLLEFEGCVLGGEGFLRNVATNLKQEIISFLDDRYKTFSRGYVAEAKKEERHHVISSLVGRIGDSVHYKR